MVCECIPPPPIFDLPPPPDLSLIWGVISDEPLEILQKVRLQSCEFNPFFHIFGSSIEFGNFSFDTFLYFLIFIFTMIITACTCATCLLRYRKYRRKRAASSINSSKFNTSSDTIVTGEATHCSYNSIRPPQHLIEISNGRLQMAPTGVLMYGSKSASNIVRTTSSPKAMPTDTFIRSMPKRMPSNSFMSRTIAIPPETYYSVGHYEEISECPNLQSPHGSETIFEDLNQNLRYLDALAYQTERKPPPKTKPPPPPRNLLANSPDSGKSGTNSDPVSPGFQDDLSSTTEPELEKIHQENGEQHMPRPRPGDIGGRESGYFTGISRLSHGSQVLHQQGKINGKSSNISLEISPTNSSNVNVKNSIQLQLYDQPSIERMTYV